MIRPNSFSLHRLKIQKPILRNFLVIIVLIALGSCKSKIIQYPVSYDNDRDRFMEFSQQLNKQILKDETALIQNYIDSTKQSFSRTQYGFWISNDGKPTPEMAKTGDFVKYEYEVSDFDGQIIYPEDEIGIRESVLGRDNLPRGLHISLQLIEEGDSAVSLMPSFMAYGSYGDRNQIGGNEPLIFKVKILDIKKREK